jgi:hypothetical protein
MTLVVWSLIPLHTRQVRPAREPTNYLISLLYRSGLAMPRHYTPTHLASLPARPRAQEDAIQRACYKGLLDYLRSTLTPKRQP